ncbi:MAG: AAA family ATPase [Candidatus Moduliflexus flocculans]|nr:AAA family ATPase [Candidatus Moduliflexus flocculans]
MSDINMIGFRPGGPHENETGFAELPAGPAALDLLPRPRSRRRLERRVPGRARRSSARNGPCGPSRPGLDIKSLGYNIFITGMVGTGRTTTIKQLLERLEKGDRPPDDILYVNNFKYPDEPVLLRPAGRPGHARSPRPWHELIDLLQDNIPDLLKSPYYTEKRDAIVEGQQTRQKDILQALRGGGGQGGLQRSSRSRWACSVKPDLIPVIEDQPVPFAKLEQRSSRRRSSPKKTFDALQDQVRGAVDQARGHLRDACKEIDEQTRTRLQGLGRGGHHPGHPRRRSTTSGPGSPSRQRPAAYLDEVETVPRSRPSTLFKSTRRRTKRSERAARADFLEYRVNLLVDNTDQKQRPGDHGDQPQLRQPVRLDRVDLDHPRRHGP